MFTIEQIQAAHAKVKSGADFPNYIKELITLGVTGYETYVADGHTDYYGNDGYKKTSPSKYGMLPIAGQSNAERFKKELKEHQQGKTDYPNFCKMSADTGVEKWVLDMGKMTCTYFDKSGNEILVETVPQ
jgi:uncharacterized protein YbcV (DUF1398 family)